MSGGLFEDEDTRAFYEDFPDLHALLPAVTLEAAAAAATAGGGGSEEEAAEAMDVDTDATKEGTADGAASGSDSDADDDDPAGDFTCLAHHSLVYAPIARAKEGTTDCAASGSESDADDDNPAGDVTCLALHRISHHPPVARALTPPKKAPLMGLSAPPLSSLTYDLQAHDAVPNIEV